MAFFGRAGRRNRLPHHQGSTVRESWWGRPSACDLAGVLLAILFAAATLRAEHLPIKIYTTADGLARNRIYGIMADSRGFVWISTADGLSLFDGYGFVNYSKRDGLPSLFVFDVLEARDGNYWVATNEGLCLLHPKGGPHLFTVYHRPEPEFNHGANALFQDRNGVIWAATDIGLYRETGPGGTALRHPVWIDLGKARQGELDELRCLVIDRRGVLWTGGGSGLYRRLPDGRAESYSTGTGNTGYVEKLLQDADGRIWAGTRAGLCRLVADPHPGQPVVERIYTEADGLGDKDVKALSLAPDGTIWVGTLFGGVSQIRIDANGEAHIRTYRRAQGLSDDSVTALAHDREGNLWVGGESAGLMRIVHGGFVSYGLADGLGSERPSQLLVDQSGSLCAVGNDVRTGRQAFISCFDGEKFGESLFPEGYRWPSKPLLQDRSGEWWLGARGLVRLGRIPFQQIPQARTEVLTAKGDEKAEVYRMFEDSSGSIWVSLGDHGARVARWQAGNVLQLLPPTNGPPEQLVSAFAEDHAGDIWMGLYAAGLIRYRNGAFTQFGEADGVPVGRIAALYVDDAGRLWICSMEGGLGRIDSPAAEHPIVRKYEAANGLGSDYIMSIAADRWGRIYVGTGRGVDRLDPATDRLVHYTTNEGLANDEAMFIARDRRGWLWFSTTRGLSRLIPEPDRPSAPPSIRITSLVIDGKAYAVSQLGERELPGLSFPGRDLQITFSSVNFAAGGVLRYQYRLEGPTGQWSPPSDQRTVNLASLSPGDYRFQARAVDGLGQVSEQPATIVFRIPPPVWGRLWFRLILLAVGSLLLYGIYRYRLDRMLELEHIRMRIATDLHDDIGSSLSQIAILSEVARRPGEADTDAMDPLGGIARISRELVDSMSDIVWAVNPKRDNLLDLTRRMRQFAGEMLVPGGIEFWFDAEGASGHVTLGADLRRQIFLIFKECINNVARHSGATRVNIAFTMAGNWLRLTIRDDGCGFDPRRPGNGHGLASMTNRAAGLRGTLEIQSGAGGTTATLAVPVKTRAVYSAKSKWKK